MQFDFDWQSRRVPREQRFLVCAPGIHAENPDRTWDLCFRVTPTKKLMQQLRITTAYVPERGVPFQVAAYYGGYSAMSERAWEDISKSVFGRVIKTWQLGPDYRVEMTPTPFRLAGFRAGKLISLRFHPPWLGDDRFGWDLDVWVVRGLPVPAVIDPNQLLRYGVLAKHESRGMFIWHDDRVRVISCVNWEEPPDKANGPEPGNVIPFESR